MRLSILALTSLAVVAFAAAPAANAQTLTTFDPAYLAQNPFVLPKHVVSKTARLLKNGESRLVMESREELTRTAMNGAMTYFRFQERRRPDGSVSIDTVLFRAADFGPVSRKSIARGDTTVLEFEPGRVHGSVSDLNGTTSFEATFDGTFFDANILDFLCVVMGRIAPQSYRVPLYVASSNRVEWYTVTVSGTMKVNFGEGETEAIKVTYSSPVGRVGVVWTVPGRMEIMREEEFPTPDARLVIDIVYE